jgi:hypothetical protein
MTFCAPATDSEAVWIRYESIDVTGVRGATADRA